MITSLNDCSSEKRRAQAPVPSRRDASLESSSSEYDQRTMRKVAYLEKRNGDRLVDQGAITLYIGSLPRLDASWSSIQIRQQGTTPPHATYGRINTVFSSLLVSTIGIYIFLRQCVIQDWICKEQYIYTKQLSSKNHYVTYQVKRQRTSTPTSTSPQMASQYSVSSKTASSHYEKRSKVRQKACLGEGLKKHAKEI